MTNLKPRILYFVPEWPASSSGVLHSTVLAEAEYLARNGFDCFFIGADVSDEKAREAEEMIRMTYGIQARIYGCFSSRHGFISLVVLARKILGLSWSIIQKYCPTHLWVENFYCATIARKIKHRLNVVTIFDVPAVYSEEVAMLNGRGIKFQICRWLENREFKKSQRLAGVSQKLKLWIQAETGRKDMIVIPCCMDTRRFCFNEQARYHIRQEYGFSGQEKVICYSGGLSKWQRVEDIIRICTQLASSDSKIKFLFLTQQTDVIKQMIKEIGLPQMRCAVRGCLPHEVPQYLSSADAGIIMRDDVSVNNVASPIKIGEYLGCGLPIILTRGIGDYSEMVTEAGVGLLLNEDGTESQQILEFLERPDFPELRNRAIAFARDNISWDAHMDNLRRLFLV